MSPDISPRPFCTRISDALSTNCLVRRFGSRQMGLPTNTTKIPLVSKSFICAHQSKPHSTCRSFAFIYLFHLSGPTPIEQMALLLFISCTMHSINYVSWSSPFVVSPLLNQSNPWSSVLVYVTQAPVTLNKVAIKLTNPMLE